MTYAAKSHIAPSVAVVCTSSPRLRSEMQNRVSSGAADLTTEPLESAQLNAVGFRSLHMMRVLERVAAAFNDADIPLLVLKGAALKLVLYAQFNERPMEDLDLLVHSEHLDRASNLLETLGAVRGEALVREDFCPRFHYEVEFSLGDVYPVKIDLHVRPFRPLRYSRLVPSDALWARAQRVHVGRATILVPSVEDMLIQLTAHAAIHGCSQRKWLRDIKLWIAAHQNDIDWNRLLATVEDWQFSLPVREGLGSAAREVGAVYPEHVISRLADMRVSWRDRLALWQSQRDADHPVAHVLVDALCTPGWRFSTAYLLAVAAPGRQHMGDWYRSRHWGWLPCAQLLRWFRPVLSSFPFLRRWFRDSLIDSAARPMEAA